MSINRRELMLKSAQLTLGMAIGDHRLASQVSSFALPAQRQASRQRVSDDVFVGSSTSSVDRECRPEVARSLLHAQLPSIRDISRFPDTRCPDHYLRVAHI